MRVGWTDTSAPAGHKLVLRFFTFFNRSNPLQSFKTAIETVSKDLQFKFAVPGFAMGMTERTKKIQLAFEELRVMHYTTHLAPLLIFATALRTRNDR
jgi:hypothetical protein